MTTSVYYSVGQNGTDHSSGGNVSITSGVATFNTAQVATNLGVGDRLTAGGKVYYLASKTSTTMWNVVTKLGATPSDLASTAVTSIAHEYTSLSAAIAGASDANHLNSTNLTAGAGTVLNIPCYYDSGPDTTSVTVSGYTTGANNYIKIYTPNHTSTEVNQSQRHAGKWDDNKYHLVFGSTIVGGVINIRDVGASGTGYYWIDGLQINKTGVAGDYDDGIFVDARNVKISNNVIKYTGGSVLYSGFAGIERISYYGGSTGTTLIWNNIIYGFQDLVNARGSGIRAELTVSTGIVNAYNNTIYKSVVGLNSTGSETFHSVNNGLASCQLSTGGTVNETTDSSAAPTFVSTTAGSEDFHLQSSDTTWNGHGTTDPGSGLFSDDVDGQPRSDTWDIGADEYVAAGGSTHNVSCSATVGTSPGLSELALFPESLAAGVGLSGADSEIGLYPESLAAGIGLSPSPSEIGDFLRSLSVALDLSPGALEVADFVESAVVQMGLNSGESETGDYPESADITVTLHATSNGITGTVMTCLSRLGIGSEASERADFSEAANAGAFLSATASEIADFIKSLSSSVSVGAAAAEVASFAKSLNSGLSISIQVTESALFPEIVNAVLSFAPTVSYAGMGGPQIRSVSNISQIRFSVIVSSQLSSVRWRRFAFKHFSLEKKHLGKKAVIDYFRYQSIRLQATHVKDLP